MFLIQMFLYFILLLAAFQLKSAKLILFLLCSGTNQSMTKDMKLMRKWRTESYTLKIYVVNENHQ